ncbi:endonuclease YncB(thermonuclease family) [Rhizobium sp. BK650]|uniref:thermonuclease family protein n=1 Tax=Rhizobium sp. BK650 TaxID=2586990 RepID=UPI001609C0BA|nr:thermonuclease family protein [Rhizobium sp. BK650]MBB3656146.1 endonuclease YncB(thermonuclease family) [Rhizobium sp. BK650]
MRPAAFITGIAGVAVVVGLLLAGQARLNGSESPSSDANAGNAVAAAPDMAEPPAPLTDEDAELIARATAPAPAEGTAARSENAAGPLSEKAPADAGAVAPAEASSAAPVGKGSVELLRPAVESAGILSFGKRRLQIANVIETPADKSCGSGGKQWPCGMMAKTALRLYLRNRTIDCDLPSDAWEDMAKAACRLGQQDIGTWLVENGWVEAQPGSPLAAAGEKAKQAKQGIHGEDPRRRPASTRRPEAAAPL